MILEWLDFDAWQDRRSFRKEARFQAAMASALRSVPGEGGDRVAWFTYFAFMPVRISKTQVIWLDWFEASPCGELHGRWGGRNGLASIRRASAWRYRLCPVSFWRWLWQRATHQVSI